MKKSCKRLIALLTVLSLIFIGYPVKAAEETPVDSATEQVQAISACASLDEIYCDFSIDVNTVHRYTDSIVPLDFTIRSVEEGEVYTIRISSSLEITHNIPATQYYSRINNEVSITINVLEEGVTQSLDALEFEYITIELVNADGEAVYTIDASLINTQYGLFVGYINDECLFDYYGVWLLDNQYVSQTEYDAIIEERSMAVPLESFPLGIGIQNSRATTTYTEGSMYVSYTIEPYSSGTKLDMYGYVYWVDTVGNIHPARYVKYKIWDRDTSNDDDLLATGTTDQNGRFDADLVNQTSDTENGGCDITFEIFAETQYAQIVSSGTSVYSFGVNCGSNINSDKYGNVTYGNDENNCSRSFSILDAIFTGGLHVKAMKGTNLAAVKVIYPWSGVLVSHYNPVNSVIHLEEDTYSSWDTVLHEYGHYVSDCYDIFPFTAISHTLSDNAITYICTNGLWNTGSTVVSSIKYDGCALAWQEGWANYFSVSSQYEQNTASMGISQVGDILYKSYSLETNSGKGEAHEIAVARVLWDMADGGNAVSSLDTDPIVWSFYNVFRYTTVSGARTFSEYMYYLYSEYSSSPSIYRNLGYLLQYQKISATLTSASFTATKATINWTAAYEDSCVGNDYYVDVYNSSMVRVYTKKITGSPCTITGTTWTNLCSNNSAGIYICIRTVPYDAAIGYEDTYLSGPYYSRFVAVDPSALD